MRMKSDFVILASVVAVLLASQAHATNVCDNCMYHVNESAGFCNWTAHLTAVPDCFPSNITTLVLTGGNIKSLDNNSFARYPDLTAMRLQNNSITTIENQTFAKLAHLKLLDLSMNQLTSLDNTTFDDVSSTLTGLSLAHNRFPQLPEECLRPLVNLDELDLSFPNDEGGVKTAQLGPVFRNFAKLTILHVNGIGLTSLNNDTLAMLNGSSLQSLKMDSNSLSTIERQSFAQLKLLQKLHLANCSVNKIDQSAFAELGQLYLLDLSQNDLEESSFNGSVCAHLPMLSELMMDSYRGKTLPHIFTNCSALRNVSLALSSTLTSLGNSFNTSLALQTLNLSHNAHLSITDAHAFNTSQIHTLDLSASMTDDKMT